MRKLKPKLKSGHTEKDRSWLVRLRRSFFSGGKKFVLLISDCSESFGECDRNFSVESDKDRGRRRIREKRNFFGDIVSALWCNPDGSMIFLSIGPSTYCKVPFIVSSSGWSNQSVFFLSRPQQPFPLTWREGHSLLLMYYCPQWTHGHWQHKLGHVHSNECACNYFTNSSDSFGS